MNVLTLSCLAQSKSIRLFGNSMGDECHAVAVTRGGSTIISGQSNSSSLYFDPDDNYQFCGFVMMLDKKFNPKWRYNISDRKQSFYEAQITALDVSSEGFIFGAGCSSGRQGDFIGMSKGHEDVAIVKFDTTGRIIFRKTLGGTGSERAKHLVCTDDGGAVISGLTASLSDDFALNGVTGRLDFHSTHDVFVVKIDRNGGIEWKHVFRDIGVESNPTCSVASDGSVYLTCTGYNAFSVFSTKSCGMYACEAAFAIKIHRDGEIAWTRRLCDLGYCSRAEAMTVTIDNGLVIAGSYRTEPTDIEDTTYRMRSGLLVSKIDSSGNVAWQKRYDCNTDARCISQLRDGTFILTGCTNSPSPVFPRGIRGRHDIALIKFNDRGEIIKSKLYGGRGYDCVRWHTNVGNRRIRIIGITQPDSGDPLNDGIFFDLGRGGESDIFILDVDAELELQ